jgi:hypothetical protein
MTGLALVKNPINSFDGFWSQNYLPNVDVFNFLVIYDRSFWTIGQIIELTNEDCPLF